MAAFTPPVADTVRSAVVPVGVVKVTVPEPPDVVSWSVKAPDTLAATEAAFGVPWRIAPAVTVRVKVQAPVSPSPSWSWPVSVYCLTASVWTVITPALDTLTPAAAGLWG